MSDPDEELKALFARQREVERARTPSFHRQMARASATARRRAVRSTPRASFAPGWGWALAAALAVAALLAAHFEPAPRRAAGRGSVDTAALVKELNRAETLLCAQLDAESSLAAWQTPTDVLLNPNLP